MAHDTNLFHNSCSENHCLCHVYMVNEKSGATRLRTRGYVFMLPFVKYNFNKKNFIVRALYSYIYSVFFWFVIRCFTTFFKCFNVLFFCDFFHCSTCAFDVCLFTTYLLTDWLTDLLTYLLTYLLVKHVPVFSGVWFTVLTIDTVFIIIIIIIINEFRLTWR